jgi:hypothetical protein
MKCIYLKEKTSCATGTMYKNNSGFGAEFKVSAFN